MARAVTSARMNVRRTNLQARQEQSHPALTGGFVFLQACDHRYLAGDEMLTEIDPLLPPDLAVYVEFDSWYSSAPLIRGG